MKPFATGVLILFLALGTFGLFVFATYSSRTAEGIGTVHIWGAIPQEAIENELTLIRSERDDFNNVTYLEMKSDELVSKLVTAIASGNGPDLVILPSTSIVEHANKLSEIPYDTVSKREFQDTYIDAGDALLTQTGIIGVPLTVDPLVMYWNRSLFAKAGISRPPVYWDEVATMAKRLTRKSENGTLIESATAFGDWANILHNTGIFVTLIKQLGVNPVVRSSDGSYRSHLNNATEGGIVAADSSLRYWTDFSDPLKPTYSWNRSLRPSDQAFVAGTLALYIGRASELSAIRAANPNLNFDVASVPVTRGGGEEAEAKMQFLSIPRGTGNPNGAFIVLGVLTSQAHAAALSSTLLLPSPRRDVEPDSKADAYQVVFRKAALKSFVFLDPGPATTARIFGEMVDTVTSGKASAGSAVRSAHDELEEILRTE